MQRFAHIVFALVAGILLGGSAALAQDQAAEEAFRPLERQLTTLFESFGEGSALSETDRRVVKELRQEVRQFNEQHPDHVRGLAAEIELLNILTDPSSRTREFVETTQEKLELIRRLVDLVPARPLPRLAWSLNAKRLNDYDEAIEVLEGYAFDYGDWPQAALYLAECYQAEFRFADALDVLDQIPDDADLDQPVRNRVNTARETAAELVELWEQEQALREQDDEADLPRVALYTSAGRIVLELFEDQAPNTVANFITLAEDGFYDGTQFHRVIPNFMAQGGDPNSRPDAEGEAGTGGPGYMIPDEVDHDDARMHFSGSLSMAKSAQPDSGGSQFFLCHQPTPHLNGAHTVFGRVIEGLDVARAIAVDDVLESIEIMRKRDHDYTFTKVGEEPPAEPDTAPRPGDPTAPDDVPQPDTPPTGGDPGGGVLPPGDG